MSHSVVQDDYWIECRYSGKGFAFRGTIDEAITEAMKQCRSDFDRYTVWLLPWNIRLAYVSMEGQIWRKDKWTERESYSLKYRFHPILVD